MKTAKKILTIMLALALFAGTLFYESSIRSAVLGVAKASVELLPSGAGIQLVREGQTLAVKEGMELLQGDIVETPPGQNAVIQFSGNGIIRMSANTKLVFAVGDTVNNGFAFNMEKGRIWVNTSYTSANIDVLAGGALLIPRRAAFSVAFDGEKTEVIVSVNQVGVGLVKDDFKLTQVIRFSATAFINSYLVAQGSQTTISLSKINENAESLKKLLYSKLIKEFLYTLYDKKEMTGNEWFIWNNGQDAELSKKVAMDKSLLINARGLKVAEIDTLGFQLQKAADRLADVLTFSREKIVDRVINSIFDQMLDAEYLLVFGRSTESKQRLDIFRQTLDAEIGRHDADFAKIIMGKLRDAYVELVYVSPGDALYEVKTAISDTLFEQLTESDDDISEKFGLVRDYINYAYSLADSNATNARIALDQYFTRLTDLIEKEKAKLAAMKNLIAEENQVVDNLFKQFPVFYQDQFFARKYALENSWLGFLPDGNAKTEEKQTIISTKIDFLKQLQFFFLNEKVTLKDANLIALRLINEINDLKTGAEVGVSQLFALRLKDYGQFLRFLKTAELGSLRGLTMKSKYDEFLAMQKEQVSIEQAIKEFVSDTPVAPTPANDAVQIIGQVRSDFEAAGITGLQLGLFTGTERLIAVKSATLDKIVFQGQYDWEKKLISEVKVGTVTVSMQPVRLDNLALIVKPKQPEKPPVVTQQQTQEVVPTVSKAERVAKILLIQKLKNSGITVTEKDITVSDLENSIFSVRNAYPVGKTEARFDFNFKNKENLAMLVVVTTPAGEKNLPGGIMLADLSAEVLKAAGLSEPQKGN